MQYVSSLVLTVSRSTPQSCLLYEIEIVFDGLHFVIFCEAQKGVYFKIPHFKVIVKSSSERRALASLGLEKRNCTSRIPT